MCAFVGLNYSYTRRIKLSLLEGSNKIEPFTLPTEYGGKSRVLSIVIDVVRNFSHDYVNIVSSEFFEVYSCLQSELKILV